MNSTERHNALMQQHLPTEKIEPAVQKLQNNFVYHAPTPEAREKFTLLRTHFLGMAAAVDVLCPDSREKSLAMTKIEEAMMWANAAIARKECPPEAPPQEKSDAG